MKARDTESSLIQKNPIKLNIFLESLLFSKIVGIKYGVVASYRNDEQYLITV